MHPLCALEETCQTFPQPRQDTYTNLKSQNCQFLTLLLQYLINIGLSTNILINSTSCPPQPKPATPAAEPRADDPLLLGVHHRSANHLLDLHQEGQCCHHHPHLRKNIFPTINKVNIDAQVGTSQKMIVFRLGKMIGAKGPGTVLVFPWLDRYQVGVLS